MEVLPDAEAPTSARVRTASISAARPFDRLGMRGSFTPARQARRPAWARVLRADAGSAYGIDRTDASGNGRVAKGAFVKLRG
ncbi:hypothetical protein GmRootV15_50520 [Variovorax sp. V15]